MAKFSNLVLSVVVLSGGSAFVYFFSHIEGAEGSDWPVLLACGSSAVVNSAVGFRFSKVWAPGELWFVMPTMKILNLLFLGIPVANLAFFPIFGLGHCLPGLLVGLMMAAVAAAVSSLGSPFSGAIGLWCLGFAAASLLVGSVGGYRAVKRQPINPPA